MTLDLQGLIKRMEDTVDPTEKREYAKLITGIIMNPRYEPDKETLDKATKAVAPEMYKATPLAKEMFKEPVSVEAEILQDQPFLITEPTVCNHCEVQLTDENWYPSMRTSKQYICNKCKSEQGKISYHNRKARKVSEPRTIGYKRKRGKPFKTIDVPLDYMKRKCRDCDVQLVPFQNWNMSSIRSRSNQCNKCDKLEQQKYRETHEAKAKSVYINPNAIKDSNYDLTVVRELLHEAGIRLPAAKEKSTYKEIQDLLYVSYAVSDLIRKALMEKRQT
jgi:hypothetical protein